MMASEPNQEYIY